MYALLIKPAAMHSKKHRRVIAGLKASGAQQLMSHEISDLRSELVALIAKHEPITLVACGGDGTVNLALNAAIDLPVTFAVLPMGTGNDFARHIGVQKLDKALETLNSNEVLNVDIGRIELADGTVHYYGAVASCGFDAQVNERANKLKGPNGTAKYLWSVFGELKDLHPLTLDINYNNRSESGQYSLIAIGNTSSYGGGMCITPAADMADGLFTCSIVKSVKRRTLVRVLPKVFSGNHIFHPAVAVDETSAISISGQEYPIYADGERIGTGPAVFTCLPARLQLKVPINI